MNSRKRLVPFAWERHAPLNQASGESPKANAALSDYVRLGPSRSLGKLCRNYEHATPELRPTRHLKTLKRWSRNYDWGARVAAYEQLLHAEELEKWNKRREQWIELEWSLAQRLVRQAIDLLAAPTKSVSPTSAARVVDVASKIARLASGMDTNQEAHRIDGERPLNVTLRFNCDLSNYPPPIERKEGRNGMQSG